MSEVGRVLLFTLIPVAATLLGGLVAAFRRPGARLRSYLQHLAAGVVFSAAAGELLPDIVRRQRSIEVVVGFSLGVGAMLAVKWLAGRAGTAEDESQIPWSLLATTGVDVLIDGLLIGIGFAAGAEEGILLTVALTLELLFLGLATVSSLSRSTKAQALGVVGGLSLLLMVGAGVGTALLGGLSERAMEVVLAFGLVALLYLVTEELLAEAHEVEETPLSAAMFFVGFLALLLVQMAVVAPGHGR